MTRPCNLPPRHISAYNNRGIAYYKLKEYKKAIKEFSKAIKLNPEFAAAYLNRGSAYDKLKQTGSARLDFKKAISIFATANIA